MIVTIREYKKEDMFSLATLADDNWADKIYVLAMSLENYDGRLERCYLAEGNGMTVGFIIGLVLPNQLLFPEFLYVKPEYRKAGIATQLLDTFEKKSGCTSSMIFYNKTLHDYYRKRGYVSGDNLEVAMKSLQFDQEEDR